MNGKKTWLTVLLALLTLLCGCRTHAHDWTEATCTAPKTCGLCGATEGEALGHDWAEATCTEPKTCRRCGATEGEAPGHDWAEATCTEPKTCRRCGATEGEALGHDWAEATETAPKTCRRCGATEGEALGHDWAEATETAPKTCRRCGATEGEPLAPEPVEEIPDPEPVEGMGDRTIEGVQTGSGVYRVRFVNRGGGDCTVWAYDAEGRTDLIVFTRGQYEGSALLLGTAPFSFEIHTNGRWTLCVERLCVTEETSFSGSGDAVTDAAALQSGTYRLAYAGENDFVVWLYTSAGETLLAKELGACTVEANVEIPAGSLAFFAIRADAAWTIEPVGAGGE